MTEAGWAEKAVSKATTCPDGVSVVYAPTVEKLLKAEHARSVRIVKAKLKAVQHAVQDSGSDVDLAYWDGQETACNDLLTALQRGRGGKG